MKWFEKQPALDVFLPLNYIFIQCKIVQSLESVFALAKSTVGKMQVDDGLLQILSKELSMQDTCDDTFLFITICLYFYVCVSLCVSCAHNISEPLALETDSCKRSRCWELTPGPLQEQKNFNY